MSWRTVVISNRCKLDVKMGFMVVRGEETTRVFLDEIALLLIENPAVALTGCLLRELTEKKIRVIFCDEKRSPYAELAPYYGSYDAARKVRTQISWQNDLKRQVWTEIVSEKIRNQAKLLLETGHPEESGMLNGYIGELTFGDETNREGHAAKVYFNALFGMDFTRTADTPLNAALNYGYGVLLSAFNREITANGYLTQLGLSHDNMFNYYNLSCDLMEPFRVAVDRTVLAEPPAEFGTEQKHRLLPFLNETVLIDGSHQTLLNAIKIYTRSVFEALNEEDISKIRFFRWEET